MWIILLCSLLALTIIFERILTLRRSLVAPDGLSEQVIELLDSGTVSADKIQVIRNHSPLGSVLAAGLSNLKHGRDDIKEAIEEAGKQAVHNLGRYLNTLGTIASITPLIGLLGTVIGMIKVFTAITAVGVGDPTVLSGGISEALITTAAGLSVGIPCLMFYRYFRSRIAGLTVVLEEQSLQLMDAIKNQPVATTSNATGVAEKPKTSVTKKAASKKVASKASTRATKASPQS